METQLRSKPARDPEPGNQAVRIALVDEDPSAACAVQEAFMWLSPLPSNWSGSSEGREDPDHRHGRYSNRR